MWLYHLFMSFYWCCEVLVGIFCSSDSEIVDKQTPLKHIQTYIKDLQKPASSRMYDIVPKMNKNKTIQQSHLK